MVLLGKLMLNIPLHRQHVQTHKDHRFAILEKYPEMRCIVQDLPGVIKNSQKLLPKNESRMTFMAHDFFTEQPVKGANIYLLRQILHDWSDKYAARILGALVPALTKNSTILIMEHILPEPGTLPTGQEFLSR